MKCEGRVPAKANLKLNETSFTDFFESPDALTRLEATDISSSATGAAARWNAVEANLSLNVDARSYGVRAVDSTKTILDCDVIIYSKHRKTTASAGTVTNWTTSSTIPSDGLNLQDAMTHEFGHCLGLGDQTSSIHAESMMTQWGLGRTKNTLSPTDIDALKFLYPPT